MTAGLVGKSGFAAIPTTAIDLPLVQRLRWAPRLSVLVEKHVAGAASRPAFLCDDDAPDDLHDVQQGAFWQERQ